MIIAVGTILSSLMSNALTYKLGTARVTAISIAMTAIALLGFSFSDSFWLLCIWAIPYGLGAGSVDASLNNFVALRYASCHMSWLHCMWGVGACAGPYIMGYALSSGLHWSAGYRWVGLLQIALSIVVLLSISLWKGRQGSHKDKNIVKDQPLSLGKILKIRGAKEVMVTFFCYCALEQTVALWASSYLVLHKGVEPETAAAFASMFFIGITAGRALNGFLTMRLSDIRLVQFV